MAFIKVYIHYVFSTKNREKCLSQKVRAQLFPHILKNAREKDIFILRLNGHLEHLHCLVSMGRAHTLAETARLIKGNASRWLNQSGLVAGKFQWQKEYFAVSVSETHLTKVQRYIENQEEHHRTMTFEEEYKLFLKNYGFSDLR